MSNPRLVDDIPSDDDVFEMIEFIVKCEKTASMHALCEQLMSPVDVVRPALMRLRIAKRIEPAGKKGWQPTGWERPKALLGQPLPYA